MGKDEDDKEKLYDYAMIYGIIAEREEVVVAEKVSRYGTYNLLSSERETYLKIEKKLADPTEVCGCGRSMAEMLTIEKIPFIQRGVCVACASSSFMHFRNVY